MTDNTRLSAQVKDLGTRLEDLEIYSRAHNVIIRGMSEEGLSYAAIAHEGQSSDTLATDGRGSPSLEAQVLDLCCGTIQ